MTDRTGRARLRSSRFLLIAILGILIGASFQNCSRAMFSGPERSTDRENSLGGGGIDGKTYANRGSCDGQVAVSSIISVKGDQIELIKEDCKPLKSPTPLAESDLSFFDNKTLLVYRNHIFDEVVTDKDQVVTGWLCQAGEQKLPRLAIRSTPDSSRKVYGALTLLKGSDAKNIELLPPSYAKPNVYKSASEATYQLDLSSSGESSAILIYGPSGGPVQKTAVVCELPQPLQAFNSFIDGATPSPLTAQAPSLFSSYGLRPPWQVAGVDYAVGVQLATLKDPTSIAIPGVSVDMDSHKILVTGSDLTLDGFDFSLKGPWSVQLLGAHNIRLTNNLFALVPADAESAIFMDQNSSDVYVGNTTVDGGGKDVDPFHRGLINMMGQRLTVEYSWFKNAPVSVIEGDWGNSPAGGSLIVRYNLIENSAQRTNSSADYISLGSGPYSRVLFNFNTIRESATSHAEGVATYSNGPVESLEVGNNTVIAPEPTSLSYFVTIDSSIAKAETHDNYADAKGMYGFAHPGSSFVNSLFLRNLDLNTGAPFPTDP